MAAASLRLSVRVDPLPDSGGAIRLELPEVGGDEETDWSRVVAYADRARRRWEAWAADPSEAGFDRARGVDPGHGVKVALGEAARHLGERSGPALRLAVRSTIPVGAGLGSSAALAVAVLSAYLAARGADVEPGTLADLALEVERRQHGFPSGVDAVTVIHGGVVWAEREGEALRGRPLSDLAPRLRRFRVYDTGAPGQTTGAVVGEVRGRVRQDPALRAVLEEMGALTARLRDLLAGTPEPAATAPWTEGDERLVELVRRYERQLEALGVVPPAARELIRAVEAAGGAAKVSGAGALRAAPGGAPGAGCLLVYPPASGEPEALRAAPGVRRLDCRLGAAGLRRETDGGAP